MEIDDLLPASQYRVRVLAVNTVGSSEPSDEIVFITSEEAPSASPADVNLRPDSSRSLAVSWTVSYSLLDPIVL